MAKSYIENSVMRRQSVTQYVILKHPSLVALRGTIVVGDRVSGIMFEEVYLIWQWPGVVALVCGIFVLAVYNWRKLQVGREALFLHSNWPFCLALWSPPIPPLTPKAFAKCPLRIIKSTCALNVQANFLLFRASEILVCYR